jgi:hypothetical protein
MARPRSRIRALALTAVGVFFGLAALYHLAIVVRPSLGVGSALRHGVFVVVDALVALGLIARPPLFFWVFTALALQQIQSHGGALFHEWAVMHRFDWQSMLVLLVVPVTWALLLAEYRHRVGSRSVP